LSEVPRSAGVPLFGNLFTVDCRAAVQSLMALARELGPILARDRSSGWTLWAVFVSGASLVHELCDESRFQKSLKGKLGEMRKVVGDGLLTAETDEPNWLKAHNIMLSNFKPERDARLSPYDAGCCPAAFTEMGAIESRR